MPFFSFTYYAHFAHTISTCLAHRKNVKVRHIWLSVVLGINPTWFVMNSHKDVHKIQDSNIYERIQCACFSTLVKRFTPWIITNTSTSNCLGENLNDVEGFASRFSMSTFSTSCALGHLLAAARILIKRMNRGVRTSI